MMWILFIVATVGTMVMVGAFLSAPQATFIANFNRLSGMDYGKTVTSAGLPLGFAVGATLTGSIFTITNFSGYFTSSYFSGEMKRVNRSQLLAMYGSLIVLTIVSMLTYASVYYSAGSDFLNAVSFLSGTGSSSYTLPAAPVLNYLVVFASPNPIVVVLSGVALFATGLGGAVLFAFVCVRNLFAWSFDGVMPSALVKLDSRRNTPYVTILVIWICSMFFGWVYYYTPFFTFYVYSTLLIFVALLLTSVAAVVFPYRAKRIFELSPSMVKKKVAGVPLISILGILGIILNAYLAYATLQPAVTPPPTGPPLVQLMAYAIVPVVAVSALVIYGISYAYRKSQGLNLAAVFKEIPPE
jgi:amino acid transporter